MFMSHSAIYNSCYNDAESQNAPVRYRPYNQLFTGIRPAQNLACLSRLAVTSKAQRFQFVLRSGFHWYSRNLSGCPQTLIRPTFVCQCKSSGAVRNDIPSNAFPPEPPVAAPSRQNGVAAVNVRAERRGQRRILDREHRSGTLSAQTGVWVGKRGHIPAGGLRACEYPTGRHSACRRCTRKSLEIPHASRMEKDSVSERLDSPSTLF